MTDQGDSPDKSGRLRSLLERLFIVPLLSADRSMLESLSPTPARFDKKTPVILITVAVSLSIQAYLHRLEAPGFLYALVQQIDMTFGQSNWDGPAVESESHELPRLLWWSLVSILSYVIIPCLVLRGILREPIRDHGLRVRGIGKDAWVYLVMLGVMVPIVFLVSASGPFQATYPFYKLAPGEMLFPRFLCWELAYFAQFVALEFFFRGFMVLGTCHRLGSMAVFVMMIPYCMIHFGKPFLETLAAILAGLALGALSLKTRSVWLGAALHISVAFTMDVMALWRTGRI